ncbi:ATP-grasp domain-containing protein [Streptoalloteichus hindustanus]|uniref:Biotin carboxylase n=1 Tax=Streptoalloteichus hindustanus TaxID=2017 RepID=A0A1M5FA84_STRHI|nr:ATP-dependent carboxylate-amine ligase [Streptoalloteichus hindustanus]SHF87981.1 Biotin carboxylase [Streptoalloteichus hindustanus]
MSERPVLLLVDGWPLSFCRHVIRRDDVDLVLLRFAAHRALFPDSYLDETAHLPAFWVRDDVPLAEEVARYHDMTARIGRRPTFFCNPSEPAQEIAHDFARRAGLPHLTEQQVRWVRNKAAMKDRFRELGLATADHRVVATTAEVKEFGRSHGWPVVVKPVDSFACIDTFLVRDDRDVDRLDLAPARSWMVEEYVGGQEWENCALVLDGAVLDVWPSAMPARPLSIVDGAINANISLGSGEGPDVDLRGLTQRIVTGMGLDHGYLHMEFFVDRGRVLVGEVGLRLAGCEIPANHGHAYGFDVFAATLDVYLGRRPDLAYRSRRCVGDLLLPLPESGRVNHITGEEELLAMPGVIEAVLRHGPGDVVTARRMSHNSAGYAHVAGESAEEVERRMRQVLDRFRIDIEPVGPPAVAAR